jgi:CRISPR system Cascade subunit CasB
MCGEKTKEQEFVKRVETLDSGRLAMLRRGSGARDPVEGRCAWLVGLIHGASSESAAFLVASLLAQYSTLDIKAGRHRATGDFGLTWKRAVADNGSDSIKRRMSTVLDAEYDPRTGDGDLSYRLRQMVRYAVAKSVGVDWPQLMCDLSCWNHPDKVVQKRWARSFFAFEHRTPAEQSQEKE